MTILLGGFAAMASYFAIAFGGPMTWDALFARHTLFDASALPLWAQIAGGFLVYEAGLYAWHRTMHSVEPLWRHLHQAHHSAERLDVWGALWFHPLDVAGFSLVGSLALVGLFGVGLEAAITVSLLTMFCGLFQHTNIRTPRWLGLFIQRPESHAVHHARGVHRVVRMARAPAQHRRLEQVERALHVNRSLAPRRSRAAPRRTRRA